MGFDSFRQLNLEVLSCCLCSRLVDWRERVARDKRASFRDETYWGKPVLGFGDAEARLLIVGLAPGAHGANRTGRVFTGDKSGEWLYRALFTAGFSNKEKSKGPKDGLELKDTYITCVVRCVPPDNKPNTEERNECLTYLEKEVALLSNVRVILTLGGFAYDNVFRLLKTMGHLVSPKPKFQHGLSFKIGPFQILGSYHPSQQNTFTGRLTQNMFDEVFRKARELIG